MMAKFSRKIHDRVHVWNPRFFMITDFPMMDSIITLLCYSCHASEKRSLKRFSIMIKQESVAVSCVIYLNVSLHTYEIVSFS